MVGDCSTDIIFGCSMLYYSCQIVLESVRNIEKCLRLKIAPKNPADMEILVSVWDSAHLQSTFAVNVLH